MSGSTDWFSDAADQAAFTYVAGTVESFFDERMREYVKVLDKFNKWHTLGPLPVEIAPMVRVNMIHEFKKKVLEGWSPVWGEPNRSEPG